MPPGHFRRPERSRPSAPTQTGGAGPDRRGLAGRHPLSVAETKGTTMSHLIRITTAVSTLALAPGAALAHPGHLTEVAGHGHWLGAAAIGAAIAIGLWQALKGRGEARAQDAEEAEDLSDEELQDA